MAYEYSGDQATVMPDNTNAMLHFSNQFAQKEVAKQAQLAAQQKADQERLARLNKKYSDGFDAKNYVPFLEKELNSTKASIQKMIKEGASESDIYDAIDQGSSRLTMANQRIKNFETTSKESIAALSKNDKFFDQQGALAHISGRNFYQKLDANGKWVDKTADELDDTKDYITQAYKENFPDLYSETSSANALTATLKDEEIQELDIPTEYNEDGTVKKLGVKAKLPTGLVGKVEAPDGKVGYEVYNQNYRLPGEKQDLLDEKGQPIKVVSDPIFKKYYNGAIGAEIERKVLKELEKSATSTDGKDKPKFSQESDYADMLRKKFLFEKLQENVKDKYVVNPGEDKSFEKQMAAKGLQIREANLQIAKTRNNRDAEKFAFEKKKYRDKEGNEKVVEPYTDRVVKEHGEEVEIPNSGGKKITYVDVKNIDPASLRYIVGDKPSKTPGAPSSGPTVKPMKIGNREVFAVDENGNWYGDGNQMINREEAYKRQIDELEKNDQIIKPPTFIKKVTNAIIPKAKTKPATVPQPGNIR